MSQQVLNIQASSLVNQKHFSNNCLSAFKTISLLAVFTTLFFTIPENDFNFIFLIVEKKLSCGSSCNLLILNCSYASFPLSYALFNKSSQMSFDADCPVDILTSSADELLKGLVHPLSMRSTILLTASHHALFQTL